MADFRKRNERADGTSMEGMAWNASLTLDETIRTHPRALSVSRMLRMFDNCVGLLMINVVEAGFMFSGSVGTGILLARLPNNKWSLPCAVGCSGVGWGFLVGASVKDVIVFIFDPVTLRVMVEGTRLRLGGQAEVALGPLGRSAAFHVTLGKRGMGSNIALAYSQGAFAGLSVEGAVVGVRHAVNTKFYGRPCSPLEILSTERRSILEVLDSDNDDYSFYTDDDGNSVPAGLYLPQESFLMVDGIYAKLDYLAGESSRTLEEEQPVPNEQQHMRRITSARRKRGVHNNAKERKDRSVFFRRGLNRRIR